MYRDTRLGGVERWYVSKPDNAHMRISDEVKECVCFLCVKETRDGVERFRYGGTAFFVGVQSQVFRGKAFRYLVTARHNIIKASRRGPLFARLNRTDEGVEFVELNGEWFYPEHEGADVAVMSVGHNPAWQMKMIATENFATEAVRRDFGIGIGDQLCITGLFTKREGAHRNIPIVRTGNIAAMPDEPLVDVNSGFEYDAYLVEARSIGGLSGSPVFVIKHQLLQMGEVKFLSANSTLHLLGVMRGHWDYQREDAAIDFNGEELRDVNMGIAIVTPIEEVMAILNSEELTKMRKRAEQNHLKENEPTLDSGFTDEDMDEGIITPRDFHEALERASRKPSEPESEKSET